MLASAGSDLLHVQIVIADQSVSALNLGDRHQPEKWNFLAPSDKYLAPKRAHLIRPIRQKTTSASQAVYGEKADSLRKSTDRMYIKKMASSCFLIPPSGSLQYPVPRDPSPICLDFSVPNRP